MIKDKKMDGNSLIHTIMLRHRITNIVGIPIVFIYFMYSLSGGANALAENWKQIIPLAIVSIVLILIAVITHERVNHRYWADAVNFLDNPERKDGESAVDYNERARKAIICLLDFPLRGAKFSLGTWPVTIAVIILSVWLLFFKFPMSLMMVMVMGGVSGGILVAVFQFHLFKQGVQPFMKEVLEVYPHYWKEEQFFDVKLGIRKKMLVSFVLLMFVMMTMMAVLLFFDSSKLIMSQWGKMQHDRIERELGKYAPELIMVSTPEARNHTIKGMEINLEGGKIYMIDSKGNSLLPGNIAPTEKEILLRIAGVKKDVKIRKDLTLMTMLPGVDEISLDIERGDMMLNTWAKVPNSEYIIVLRRSFVSFMPRVTRIIVVSILVVLFGIFVSMLFTHYASQDTTKPMNELVVAIEKVSRGELTQELRLLTYDEVGLLAIHSKKMIENLRGMIKQIDEASARVEDATVSIVDGFKRVSDGSRSQSGAVDETSAALNEMNASIKGIGENVETLASTGQQSSASLKAFRVRRKGPYPALPRWRQASGKFNPAPRRRQNWGRKLLPTPIPGQRKSRTLLPESAARGRTANWPSGLFTNWRNALKRSVTF